MANKVRIVTDSTANFPEIPGAPLTVLPITVSFGTEDYLDGITLSHREFYEKLPKAAQLPTTSQITPFTFEETFREILEAGEDVVAITISSGLSGTFANAASAAKEFSGRVFVVDSASVAVGSGALVQYALQLASQDLSAAQVAEKVQDAAKRLRVVALLDTLEYLKRGGRISRTVAFAGGLLSIKPVVSMEGGTVTILGKARGIKQGNRMMVQKVEELGGMDLDLPILLGYAGVDEEMAVAFRAETDDYWQPRRPNLPIASIGGAVGVHVGPGAICLAFFLP